MGPVYGAPYGAFPQGTTWRSIREMLSEVFSNIHHEWVQDFLFRPDPKVQAQLLTSPDNLENSSAFTQRIYSDPGTVPPNAAFEKLMVAVLVPAYDSGDLVAKVMVESHTSSELLIRRTDRVLQAIGDKRTRCNLTVSIDETAGTVEVWYNGAGGGGMFMMAEFRENELRKALSPGYVDIDAVERALIKTLIGTEPPMESTQVKITDCGQVGVVGQTFPAQTNVTSGDWYSRSMLGVYSASGTLVFSTPYSLIMSRGYGVAAHAFKQMMEWGVRDRLVRLKISVPFEIPCTYAHQGSPTMDQQSHGSSSSTDIKSIGRHMGTSKKRIGLQLAPAPRDQQAENALTGAPLTFAQKADLEYEAKMERKRQRNRIAAAKSNAKKSAERKKRLAAGNSTPHTGRGTGASRSSSSLGDDMLTPRESNYIPPKINRTKEAEYSERRHESEHSA